MGHSNADIFCMILFASNLLAFYMIFNNGLKVKKLDNNSAQFGKLLGLNEEKNSAN